jgi:hypothetical protein
VSIVGCLRCGAPVDWANDWPPPPGDENGEEFDAPVCDGCVMLDERIEMQGGLLALEVSEFLRDSP